MWDPLYGTKIGKDQSFLCERNLNEADLDKDGEGNSPNSSQETASGLRPGRGTDSHG